MRRAIEQPRQRTSDRILAAWHNRLSTISPYLLFWQASQQEVGRDVEATPKRDRPAVDFLADRRRQTDSIDKRNAPSDNAPHDTPPFPPRRHQIPRIARSILFPSSLRNGRVQFAAEDENGSDRVKKDECDHPEARPS
jgi:hypothetical protein